MRFTPDKTYEGLLKQANALHTLVNAMEKTKTFQSVKIEQLNRELCIQGFEEINAQRETNRLLTETIEFLDQRVDELQEEKQKILETAASALMAPSCDDCANKAKVNGASQESFCSQCIWGSRWKANHFKPMEAE